MKLFIFTYAPAGLGHLRVTDALADKMPEGNPYYLLGSIDRFITWAHRFTSINSFGKFIFLRSQYGIFELAFTKIYTKLLILTSGNLRKAVKTIIDHHQEVDEVWVIATHFGMAHQIGSFKERLSKETGKKIRLIVQVTDDTTQIIWCVKGADITFVPSKFTQKEFEAFAEKNQIRFESAVIPYPLSSTLTKRIKRVKGLRADAFRHEGTIRIAVPISGAMVGLSYFNDLIKSLIRISNRFQVWVLVRKSPLTQMFILAMTRLPNVVVVTGDNDAQMVGLYELIYQQNIIHLEITKPSEQAFKAIISPRRIGGSILLFTDPVGRQEEDNMKFLHRHGLVAGVGTATHERGKGPTAPRAIKLPQDPKAASKYILHATENGIFMNMASRFHFSKESLGSGEIGPKGAEMFWRILNKRFGQ